MNAQRMLSRAEVASRLGVSERTVRRLGIAGVLEEIRVSERLVRIPEESVERHMTQNKKAPPVPEDAAEQCDDPTWEEALAVLRAAKPAKVTRAPVTLVIDLMPTPPGWIATCGQLPGFQVYGIDRNWAATQAHATLSPWIGTHVALAFRDRASTGSAAS